MPEPGHRVVGRYELQERVGAGGMGVVWRAVDTVLGRVVALKQVLLSAVGPEEVDLARQRVAREARIAARLHHPRAVSIFDVVEEDGDPWLVLEYLPSRSLDELLAAEGTVGWEEAARIGAAVADALAAAHAEGVVHRDVKPGNVLLGADGVVKLTDFGISTVVGERKLTRAGLVVGTPAYLAPEVADGHEATSASDVFGLGALLYAVLEGRAPFEAGSDGNVLRVLREAAAGRFPPLRHAGPLTDVLTGFLDVDPARRPTAAAARDMLQARAGGHTRPARPPRPRTTVDADPTQPVRRRRVGLAVAAVVAAVALTVTAVVATRDGSGGTGPQSAQGCDTTRGNLTVGLIAPLSGSQGPLGVGMRNAADLAVDQANARCAVPGYRLVLDARDDGATPIVAGAAAAELGIDPSVVGVVGTMNSLTAQAVQPVLAARGIVQISPANTFPRLTLGPQPTTAPARPYPSYFRMSATDLVQGPFGAQYLVQQLDKKRLAVIDDGRAYGATLAGGFAEAAVRYGGTVVVRETVGERDTDFTALVARIRAQNPDAVYYGGEYPVAGLLSGALGTAGLNVPLMGGDGILNPRFITLGGRPGDYATIVGAPAAALPTAQRFITDYAAAQYGAPAGAYGVPTYDAVGVVVTAVAAAVRDGTWTTDVRPAVVRNVQATDLLGAGGPIAFDQYGDTRNRVLTVYRVENGALVPVRGSTAAYAG